MSAPATASFSEFARLAGFKPGYVTQLKRDDRLVLTDDGKAVRVVESMERIKATRDPARGDVAARHAAARAAIPVDAAITAPALPGANVGAAVGADAQSERIGSNYQAARAVKERYLAMSAKRDYEISIGKLLDAEQVRAAVADATTTLRTRLESIAPILGPQVAPITDESRCTAIVADAIEHALAEMARQFKNITPDITA